MPGKRHGMWRSPEYHSWATMVARCTYAGNPRWEKYGGRGIKVCDRWRNSFQNFYKDMGTRPMGMTLDRIDNDKDYTPENCRWADKYIQAINSGMRSNNTSGYKGVSYYKTRNQWIAYITVKKKIIKLGYYTEKTDAVDARRKAEEKYYQPLLMVA